MNEVKVPKAGDWTCAVICVPICLADGFLPLDAAGIAVGFA